MRVVSLFSGAGGLDLGFKQAGHEIVWANDIDKDACETYTENIGQRIDLSNKMIIHIPTVPSNQLIKKSSRVSRQWMIYYIHIQSFFLKYNDYKRR